MYDIRQFRPVLYLVVLLGFSGFGLASLSPGLWVFSVGAAVTHAVLHGRGKFRALPGWAANMLAVLVFLVIVQNMLTGITLRGGAIQYIGHGLVFLQLIKIYEAQSNRNHAQLLVLSLVLMVASAISTASLLFGVVLVAYLFLSLYCCLLFHLKVETDEAKARIPMPALRSDGEDDPAVLRQDQRRLASSMRRLTLLVSVVAVVMAVVVFLFFPRGPGQGMFVQLRLRSDQTLTGFSEQVNFSEIARIMQNNTVVAYVKLRKDGQPWQTAQPLLLRGLTFDQYTGGDTNDGPPWQWRRTSGHEKAVTTAAQTAQNFSEDLGAGMIEQEVLLAPNGTSVLFSIAGAATIVTEREVKFTYQLSDETMRMTDPVSVVSDFRYTMLARGDLLEEPTIEQRMQAQSRPGSGPSVIHPRLAEIARRPEVSGVDERGRSLAELRGSMQRVHALDEQIAEAIFGYLRANFTYTLDLTTERKLGDDEDRLLVFMEEFRKGHCEYFAGSMTLLCQSLGLKARMVTGFRCADYNDMSDAYTVRQSDAHAWVEVRTARGWVTYDPTSARAATTTLGTGVMARAKRLLDYLEYSWASAVVAYDRDSRDNLVQSLDMRMTKAAVSSGNSISKWRERMSEARLWGISAGVITVGIVLMLVIMTGAIALYVYERLRLARRARRVNLDFLPASEQYKLLKQLSFFEEMVRMLQRQGIGFPQHQTPLEFAASLTFLSPAAYQRVNKLTRIFYRIRFGDGELDAGRFERVQRALGDLELLLEPARGDGGRGRGGGREH